MPPNIAQRPYPMVRQLLAMIMVVGLGFGLKRAGVLGPQDQQTLGKLLTHVAIPAVIMKTLATASITADLIALPLCALVVVLGLTLIAGLGVTLLGLQGPRAGALITCFASFEGGAIGYPLVLLATGESGLSRLVLFDLAQAIYLLTVVYSLAAWFGPEPITPGQIAENLVKTPFFWAIVAGLALNLLGERSQPLLDLLQIPAAGFLLLVLLLLGITLRVEFSGLPLYGGLALAKIACGLGLGWLASRLLGLQGLEQTVVLLGAALPPSLLAILFCQEHQLDSRFTLGMISMAVPLYLMVITLYTALQP
ncbi:MAG: AEC family transporter [Cyanobacteria bacterium REEB459]|nr:AEC family transporter [Cyanobacteria bacterium REEB459]